MKYLLFGISIAYLVGLVWVFPDEYTAFQVSQDEPVDWYLARDSVKLPEPRSIEAHYMVMEACDRSVISVIGTAVAVQTAEPIWRLCLSKAEALIERTPEFATAHLVRASALAKLGDVEASFDALRTAEEMSPNLAWMAMRRFDIAAQNDGVMVEEVRDLMARDVMRSATDRFSAGLLARRFAAYPNLRDFIVEVLEDEPQYQQNLLSAYSRLRS